MLRAPSYDKWCERRLWTVHESICLMLAIEPDAVPRKDWRDVHVGGVDPVIAAIQQYSELAAESMRSGELKPFGSDDLAWPVLERRVEPRLFLEWARSRAIAVPDELLPVLAREPMRPPARPRTVLEHIGHGYRGADHIGEAHEEVLGAALAALRSYPERCREVADIRRVIDDNACLIWPETGRPPLPAAEIENLLSRWIDRFG